MKSCFYLLDRFPFNSLRIFLSNNRILKYRFKNRTHTVRKKLLTNRKQIDCIEIFPEIPYQGRQEPYRAQEQNTGLRAPVYPKK